MEKNIKLKISGMNCSSCSGIIEKTLNEMEGISGAVVSHESGSADIKYDSDIVEPDAINLTIEELGFHVVG